MVWDFPITKTNRFIPLLTELWSFDSNSGYYHLVMNIRRGFDMFHIVSGIRHGYHIVVATTNALACAKISSPTLWTVRVWTGLIRNQNQLIPRRP